MFWPFRHWFPITREWVERREAILRAQEDAIIYAAYGRATGAERRLLAALIEERARDAAATAREAESRH